MLRRYLIVALLLCAGIFAEHSLVFVYVGPKIPAYVQTAVDQAASFNEGCDIYLIGDKKALGAFRRHGQQSNVKLVHTEDLPITRDHDKFRARSRLDRQWKQGFWFYTSERFFWISALMEQKKLSNVVHIESDNMVYVDFATLMPIFQQHYPHVGMVMDCEVRCIPSIVYFRGPDEAKSLCRHFLRSGVRNNDMQVLASFRNRKGSPFVNELPIMPIEYATHEQVCSPEGHTTNRPQVFARWFNEFNSIFDGAAIGQFLGGIDPIHPNSKPGFINETSLFNPSRCQFEWKTDEKGRRVPYAVYGGRACRINNLHIHSKRLIEFR